MWLVYALLVLVVLALVWSFRGEKRRAFAPLRMFLFGWLLVLSCMASGMIAFHESMHLITFILLLCSIAAFVAGAYIADRNTPDVDRSTPNDSTAHTESRLGLDKVFLAVMSVLAVVGIIGLFGDFASGGVARVLEDPSTLSMLRTERWDDFYSAESGLSVIHSVGIAGCMTIAAVLPHFIRQRRALWSCFSVVCAIAVVADSLLAAGRFSIGVLVLVLGVGFTLSPNQRGRHRLLTVPRIAIAAVVSYYFFIIFPVQRNPALATAVEQHLGWAADANLPDWVKNVAAHDGFSSFTVFAYSTGYFSRALDKLNYFIVHTDISNWYLLGQYNLPQFSRVIGTLTGSGSDWYDARVNIATLMHAQGLSLNPWATGVRDLVIDFGLLGAVISTFIFGFVAQRIYNSAIQRPGLMVNAAAAYLSVSSFIFAFVGPSQVRVITTSLMLIGIIYLLTLQRTRLVNQRTTGKRSSNYRIDRRPSRKSSTVTV